MKLFARIYMPKSGLLYTNAKLAEISGDTFSYTISKFSHGISIRVKGGLYMGLVQ